MTSPKPLAHSPGPLCLKNIDGMRLSEGPPGVAHLAFNTAIIYSLIATCKLHNVNAYDWLKYVLTVMPTFPANRISELLPHNWKAEVK